jgi:ribosomal protein S18 acetylase RimI-like enzyme
MCFEIELMREENLAECAEVIRRGFLTVAKDFGLTKENSPTNGAFIQKERLAEERGKGHIMYGMTDQSKIIGYMQLERNTQELYYLQKLVILPEYRHKGLGTRLLDYAREQVGEMGGKRISIGIIEENAVLKNWYLAYGFKPTGTRKFEHLPFTVGFMELEITGLG